VEAEREERDAFVICGQVAIEPGLVVAVTVAVVVVAEMDRVVMVRTGEADRKLEPVMSAEAKDNGAATPVRVFCAKNAMDVELPDANAEYDETEEKLWAEPAAVLEQACPALRCDCVPFVATVAAPDEEKDVGVGGTMVDVLRCGRAEERRYGSDSAKQMLKC
jgi:hypothetical protein